MRRLFLLPITLALVVACDPKLEIQTTPGDGGAEGGGTGPTPPPAPPPSDDGGDAGDDGGGDDGGGTDGGSLHPFTGAESDFAAGEKLPTSSSASGYDAYVAWDAKNVYFGMKGADIGSGATDKWVLIYLGSPGAPGTTQGIGYNCGGSCTAQQPTLPFSASDNLRWKVNDSYSNVQHSTGGAWADDSLVPLVAKHTGTFVEMAVSRAALGSPSKLDVHVAMLIEEMGGPGPTTGPGWTYAGVPSTSLSPGDGWNPSYTKYFEFDLGDVATAPNTYTPKP